MKKTGLRFAGIMGSECFINLSSPQGTLKLSPFPFPLFP